MADEMLIRSVLPYFGGKRTLGPDIAVELGHHSHYFEPFCGGLAVLFAKESAQKETVNDLHGDAINLVRVLQRIDDAEELYERLSRVIVCDGLLADAAAFLEDGKSRDRDEVEWAYWYFLASWMQRNGVAGTDRMGYQLATRWTKEGGSPAVRFRNVVASLPWFHRRLLNVVVLKRNAFSIIPRFQDAAGTAIYVDPPYSPELRTGFESHAGEHSRYRHEFDHVGEAAGLFHAKRRDDHERLRDMLVKFNHARIVISYYDCQRVRELYAGWTFIKKDIPKNLGRGNGQGIINAPELLIVNGPSFAGQTPTAKRSRRRPITSVV